MPTTFAGGVFNEPGLDLGYRTGQITRSYADMMGPYNLAIQQQETERRVREAEQAVAARQQAEAQAQAQQQQMQQAQLQSQTALAREQMQGQYGLASDYNRAVYQQGRDERLSEQERQRQIESAQIQERRDSLLAHFQEGRDYREAGFQNQRDYNQAVYHAMHQFDQAGYEWQRQERQGQQQEGRDYRLANIEAQHQQRGFTQQDRQAEMQNQYHQQQQVLGSDLQAQLMRTQLTEREASELRQMRNRLAAIRTAPGLSDQDRQIAMARVETGIDFYEQRLHASQVISQELDQRRVRQQLDFNAAAEQALTQMRTNGIVPQQIYDDNRNRIGSAILDPHGRVQFVPRQDTHAETMQQQTVQAEQRSRERLGTAIDTMTQHHRQTMQREREASLLQKEEERPAWLRAGAGANAEQEALTQRVHQEIAMHPGGAAHLRAIGSPFAPPVTIHEWAQASQDAGHRFTNLPQEQRQQATDAAVRSRLAMPPAQPFDIAQPQTPEQQQSATQFEQWRQSAANLPSAASNQANQALTEMAAIVSRSGPTMRYMNPQDQQRYTSLYTQFQRLAQTPPLDTTPDSQNVQPAQQQPGTIGAAPAQQAPPQVPFADERWTNEQILRGVNEVPVDANPPVRPIHAYFTREGEAQHRANVARHNAVGEARSILAGGGELTPEQTDRLRQAVETGAFRATPRVEAQIQRLVREAEELARARVANPIP